jgi:regulatory protein
MWLRRKREAHRKTERTQEEQNKKITEGFFCDFWMLSFFSALEPVFSPQNLSLKGRALRALAGRDYSRVELERKLSCFEEEPGQLAKALDELQAKGFLNEQRAADSLVHRRGQKLGTARVVQEMRTRGIEAEAIESATVQLKASELERAREVWRKKFGEAAQDATARGKQMRFLISRGFSSEIIRRVVAGVDVDEL